MAAQHVLKGHYRETLHHYEKMRISAMTEAEMIAAHGIPQREHLQINHKNTLKDDNRLLNLELVTNSDNQKHAKACGLPRGGWKNAKRDLKGRFLSKKTAGARLDGGWWREFPE